MPVFKNYILKKNFYNQTCPGGTVSDPIEYSVPQGRYISFISQADADMQAAKDADMYGQAIANRTPGACKQITIYAKLFHENAVYYATSTYADVVVKFYSDPACTKPVSVNNLPINYVEFFSGGGGTPHNTIANGFQTTLIKSALLYYEEYECDYGDWPCYYKGYTYEYYLTPNPNYQIAN
ncbi:MAG: hypothetical protein IPJ81_17445 [Chitinophagaceae bacterium]|nr:hypothetical protein [Chitinophagaceae bacterium]